MTDEVQFGLSYTYLNTEVLELEDFSDLVADAGATPAALAAELRAALEQPGRLAQTRDQAARLRALLAQPARGTAADWLARQLGP